MAIGIYLRCRVSEVFDMVFDIKTLQIYSRLKVVLSFAMWSILKTIVHNTIGTKVIIVVSIEINS